MGIWSKNDEKQKVSFDKVNTSLKPNTDIEEMLLEIENKKLQRKKCFSYNDEITAQELEEKAKDFECNYKRELGICENQSYEIDGISAEAVNKAHLEFNKNYTPKSVLDSFYEILSVDKDDLAKKKIELMKYIESLDFREYENYDFSSIKQNEIDALVDEICRLQNRDYTDEICTIEQIDIAMLQALLEEFFQKYSV